jgi:hypothetical protein
VLLFEDPHDGHHQRHAFRCFHKTQTPKIIRELTPFLYSFSPSSTHFATNQQNFAPAAHERTPQDSKPATVTWLLLTTPPWLLAQDQAHHCWPRHQDVTNTPLHTTCHPSHVASELATTTSVRRAAVVEAAEIPSCDRPRSEPPSPSKMANVACRPRKPRDLAADANQLWRTAAAAKTTRTAATERVRPATA